MTSSVSRTERLLNLVIALLSTRAPLSRAAIQSKVAGYDANASVSAFERMFERDLPTASLTTIAASRGTLRDRRRGTGTRYAAAGAAPA